MPRINLSSSSQVLGAGLIFLFLSCGSKNEQEAVAADSMEETASIDSVLTETEITKLSLSGFGQYMKNGNTAFSLRRFTLAQYWSVDSLIREPFAGNASFYDAYKPFLVYSQDSSWFVDLDSYNIILKKNKNGSITGKEGGPDTEVSVVHPKTKTKYRLLFLGPGGSVEDAAWANDHTVMLFGINLDDDNKPVAAIWKIDLPAKAFYLYQYENEGVLPIIRGYARKTRLKNIEFK
jgi:hypothetical protein